MEESSLKGGVPGSATAADDSRALHRRRWRAVILLLVAGGAALLLLQSLTGNGVSRSPTHKVACANNLKHLGAMIVQRQVSGKLKYLRGPAFLLEAYRFGFVERGKERVFLCPDDPQSKRLAEPEFREAYAHIDPKNPDPGLLSYAVRDFERFPLPSSSRGPHEPLALCPWHEGSVNVLYDDSAVEILTAAELGLAPGEPIVLGPSAKSDFLKQFLPLGR